MRLSSTSTAKPIRHSMASHHLSRSSLHNSNISAMRAQGKCCKRLLTIGFSAAILVGIVFAAIAVSEPETPPAPSIICCYRPPNTERLYSYIAKNNISDIDPQTLFQVSVLVTIDGLYQASKHLEELGLKQPLNKLYTAALKDCQGLMQLAISQLNDTLPADDITSAHAIDDLKTWLSSALTMQDTCADSFRNAPATLRTMINGVLKNTTEMSSNSLAMLKQVSKFLKSLKLNRRLLGYDPSEGYPYWVKPNVRRLLQDAGPQLQPNMVVAQDGSGDYGTITDAIAAVPTESEQVTVIYVKKGTYKENIWISEDKWNVMLVGDGMDQTIMSFDLNYVDGVPTFSTATLGILARGFVAKDIAFANTAGPAKQQAVAVMSASDKAVFYHVKFDGYQSTLYSHSNRQFYRECTILGTIDFIFGNSAAVFQDCTLSVRSRLAGSQYTITAQSKSDRNMNTGFSIHNCKVVPAENVTSAAVYLGRPWRPYSTTVFMKSVLSSVINPAGWLPWNGAGTEVPDTIFYGEFENTGPGAATEGRVKWKGVYSKLNVEQATAFTVANFIGGDNWLLNRDVPYKSDL